MAPQVSSNVYLRRIHNSVLAMDWLLKPVIPRASWPKVTFKTKRAITADEHRRIMEREKNLERHAFCLYLANSQSRHQGGAYQAIAGWQGAGA